MNKLQGILPAKTLTMIQSIVCIALILLIVIMSFGTIFTVKIEKTSGSVEMFDKIVNSMGDGEKAEMPDEVDVSAPYLLKSLGSLGSILKGGMKTIKNAMELSDSANQVQNDMDNGEYGNIDNDADELEEKANQTQAGINEISDAMKSEAFVGLIALIVVIAQAFGQSFILGIIYIALMAMTLVIPITAIVCLIKSVICFFMNLANPGEGYSKVVKSFGSVFVMFPTMWLLKIIAPQITFGASVTVIVVALIVGLVVGLAASRLKGYTPSQFKYVNLIQAASLVSVIGYFIFMLNIDKTNLFETVFDGMGAFAKTAKFSDVSIVILLMLAMVSLMFTTCKYIQKIACRLCCMTPAPKKKQDGTITHVEDTNIASSAIALALVIIPVALMVTSFKLDLGENMTSFVLFSIGIVIMFAAEIVLSVLKKKFDITPEDVHAVLTGCPGETVAAEETAEAESAEAVAEEIPAEEAVVIEEAPVEEAPATEEAPAEEPIEIDVNKDAE